MGRPAYFKFLEQRLELKEKLDNGMSRTEIANEYGFDYGVVVRELKRGTPTMDAKGTYDPYLAQARYEGKDFSTGVFDTEKKKRLLAECLKANMSFEIISQLFNCTWNAVRNTVISEYIKAYDEALSKKRHYRKKKS